MLRTKEKNLMKEREIQYCEGTKILESRVGQDLNKRGDLNRLEEMRKPGTEMSGGRGPYAERTECVGQRKEPPWSVPETAGGSVGLSQQGEEELETC